MRLTYLSTQRLGILSAYCLRIILESMVSRSASRSEGEYSSSDSEDKANKSSKQKNINVNRNSRHESSYSRRSRSRSRSPYRASRGEKRRFDEDLPAKNDSRTFKVRYEHDRWRDNQTNGHRAKKSRTHSPNRSRSRSPYRAGKESESSKSAMTKQAQSVSTQEQKSDGVPLGKTNTKTVEQIHDSPNVKIEPEVYVTTCC